MGEVRSAGVRLCGGRKEGLRRHRSHTSEGTCRHYQAELRDSPAALLQGFLRTHAAGENDRLHPSERQKQSDPAGFHRHRQCG